MVEDLDEGLIDLAKATSHWAGEGRTMKASGVLNVGDLLGSVEEIENLEEIKNQEETEQLEESYIDKKSGGPDSGFPNPDLGSGKPRFGGWGDPIRGFRRSAARPAPTYSPHPYRRTDPGGG